MFLGAMVSMALLAEFAKADERQEITTVIENYVKALYARDFRAAYEQISSADQRLKDVHSYNRERGEFRDFTLEAARAVAQSVSVRVVELRVDGERGTVKVTANVPDATKLNPLMLDWESERLERLSASERKTLLDTIDRQRRDKKIAMVAGEETFNLVKEAGGWKLFLNWAAGVKLTFQPAIPASAPVAIRIAQSEVTSRPGQVFRVAMKITNTGKQTLSTRIGHSDRTARAARLSRSGRLWFHPAAALATRQGRRVRHDLSIARHAARPSAPAQRHLRSERVTA